MGTNPLLFVLPLIVKVLYLQQDIIIDNEKRKKNSYHCCIAAVFKGAFFPAKNFISFIHKF